MPVGSDPLVEDKRRVLCVAIKESGREARFPVYRPDEPPFDITKLVDELQRADSVLADLSHERPSCYYELGVAQAIGKPICLIAQAGTAIHQCANRHSVRFYNDLSDLKLNVVGALGRGTNRG